MTARPDAERRCLSVAIVHRFITGESSELMNAVALTIVDQFKLLYFLVERELKGRYSRSPIGVLSAIAEPLAVLMILTVVFTYVKMRNVVLGDYILLFFATGYLPLHCFKAGASSAFTAFARNRKLLYISKFAPLYLFITGGAVSLFIMSALMALITLGFMLLFSVDAPKNISLCLAVFVMNNIMGISMGAINTCIATRFPYWVTIFSILTAPLLILSGIFYTAASINKGALRFLQWNPFFHSTELMRENFFYGYTSPIFSWPYYGGSVLVLFCIGLLAERFGRRGLMRQALNRGADQRSWK